MRPTPKLKKSQGIALTPHQTSNHAAPTYPNIGGMNRGVLIFLPLLAGVLGTAQHSSPPSTVSLANPSHSDKTIFATFIEETINSYIFTGKRCSAWIPPAQPGCKSIFASKLPVKTNMAQKLRMTIAREPGLYGSNNAFKGGVEGEVFRDAFTKLKALRAPLNSLFPSLQLGPVEGINEMAHLLDIDKFAVDDVYKAIRGSSDMMPASDSSGNHEVLRAIKARVESLSKPGARKDKFKIALAIEGGGMRGSVAAGMAAALEQLGLTDVFDVVYGSSAGALVGAYFVGGGGLPETQRFFEEVCESGNSFVDTSHVLSRLLDMLRYPDDPDHKPFMSLDVILRMMSSDSTSAGFDWKRFEARNLVQPLRIIASDVEEGRAVALGREESFFHDRQSLMQCLKASCFLPGLAGMHPVQIKMQKRSLSNLHEKHIRVMPMVDAVVYEIFEPIPYRSAIKEGCTHVLVLRTWPDELPLPQSFMKIFERVLAPVCLKSYPNVLDFMFRDQHSRIYGEDILLLNQGARGQRVGDTHILPVAVPKAAPVSQMELKKEVVVEGIFSGFSQALRILGPVADQRRRQQVEGMLESQRASALSYALSASVRSTYTPQPDDQ